MADQQQVSLLTPYFVRKDKDQVHSGDIRPSATDTYDLGASNRRYDNVYAKSITADTIGGTLGGQTWTYGGDMNIEPVHAGQHTTVYIQNTDVTYEADLNVERNIILGGTVDGVDLATFEIAYNAHIIDVDAHHDLVTVTTGLDITGQQVSLDFSGTTPTTVNAGDAGSTGASAYPSHHDHEHPVSTAIVGTIQPDASAAEGSSTSLARSDHTHAIAAAAAGTIQPDDAAAEGTSTSFSRADHVHAIVAAAPITLDVESTANVEGTSTSFVRADHEHAVTTSSNPGANDFILASDTTGQLQLLRLGIGEVCSVDNWIQMTDGGGIGDATGLRIVFDETASSFDYYGGDILFSDATVIGTVDGDITFHPGGTSTVEMYTDVTLKSDHWVSQSTGWGITYAGHGDFRSLYADELHVQAFIADIYQAVVGGLIITKSRARLSRDFTVPVYPGAIVGVNQTLDYFSVAGDLTTEIDDNPRQNCRVKNSTGNNGWYTISSTSYDSGNDETDIYVTTEIPSAVADGTLHMAQDLYVEDLEGWEDVSIFASGDYVKLRVIDTSGGGLIVTDVWGQVYTYTDLTGGEQRWMWDAMDDGGVPLATVFTGSIALDYGASGNGVWEATVLDAAGAPYSQVTTWTTNPWTPANFTTHTRLGELTGLGFTGEYGLYAGQDTNYTYLLLTDTSFEAHGLDLKLYEGTTNTVWLDPATPKFVMGDGASTDTYASGNGIWMGVDSGTYKMRIGNSASGVFYYTGVDVRIYGDSGDYLKASGTGMEFISDGNAWFTVKDSTVTVGRVAGGEYVTVSSAGIYMYGGTYNTMQLLSSGDVHIGLSTGTIGNLWYDYSASTLYLRRGTTNIITLPSSGNAQIIGTLDVTSPGVITAGSGSVKIDAGGISMTVGDHYADVHSYRLVNIYGDSVGYLNSHWLQGVESYTTVVGFARNYSGEDAYLDLIAESSATSTYAQVGIWTYPDNTLAAYISVRGLTTSPTGYIELNNGSVFIGNNTTSWQSGASGYLGIDNDLHVGGGIVSGSIAPGTYNPTAGQVLAIGGDIKGTGGLYVGPTIGTNPASNMAIISGGLHVGDNSAPTNDCITMTSDVYRNAWTSYTPSTFLGWSSRSRTACYYKRVGKMVFVLIDIEGLSDNTACQVSLPVQRNSSNVDSYQFCRILNSGTTAVGLIQINASYTVAAFFPAVTGGNWSTGGANKHIKASFWYEGV
jgi:hypothetical protein